MHAVPEVVKSGAMSILIYRNGQQEGPFDAETLRQGIGTGVFSPEDFAFQDGCADWVPLRTLVEAAISAPPTAPAAQVQAAARKIEEKAGQVESALAGLLGEDQNPAAVEKIVSKAKDLLTSGERIIYIGVQKKPIVTISPEAVLLTNKRFMIVRPKLMGMTFDDHLWREVSNVHMSEQMLTATISCTIVGGKKLEIDSIPKAQARRIYAYAQEAEERMHEERRSRDMEEKRAAAGGVIVQAPLLAPAQQPVAAPTEDPVAILGKLKKMVEAGLIEPSEYETKKAEILSRM